MKLLLILLILLQYSGRANAVTSSKVLLNDGEASFGASVLAPADPRCTVIFAVGSGGNPARHLHLLNSLAEGGCSVIAPHFDRLLTPRPSNLT